MQKNGENDEKFKIKINYIKNLRRKEITMRNKREKKVDKKREERQKIRRRE